MDKNKSKSGRGKSVKCGTTLLLDHDNSLRDVSNNFRKPKWKPWLNLNLERKLILSTFFIHQ